MNIKDMDSFKNLELALKTLPPSANERSLYAPLISFFVPLAKEQLNNETVIAVAEETGGNDEEKVGFPDITLRIKGNALGWVEVKLPTDSLNNQKYQNQFDRYKNAFQNLLITNLREWQLWQWNQDGKAILVKEILWNASSPPEGGNGEISDILVRFFEGSALEVRTPKQLALALARKAQLLSKQVEEIYDEKDEESQLFKLKHTFQQTLIQDITPHQFSNMVAETIAYSLFLARLEYENKHPDQPFTLTVADDFLPKNVPILRDLYNIVLRVSESYITIHQAAQLLIDQLNASDIERIRRKLTEHKPGEDPVIQFYEPFLNAYDPKEREARGVYYTPKPVVDYIVRSVDSILKSKFEKEEGLADESVQILDPATGSGTFLMSAVQQVYVNVKEVNQYQGADMVKRVFDEKVLNHILKHFYGFELLVAPYAVAHLKLTLELERMGFDFEQTYLDGDSENNRLKIYLANTLDDPNTPPKSLFGFDSITDESKKAQKIKKDEPILAIIGNPPYSGISMNMQPKMRELVEKYKYINGIKILERGALQLEKNLNDDYVKFISFAQGMVQDRNRGVVAYISNNGYLDNLTLRGMRKNLLDSFDKIYVLNLHGNRLRGDNLEEKDESVFNISLGTSIIFLVRDGSGDKKIFYSEKKGTKISKFNYLLSNSIDSTKWLELNPKSENYFFLEVNEEKEEEHEQYPSITELMPLYSIGLITSKDKFLITYEKDEVEKNVEKFKNFYGDNESLCKALNIPQKKGWDIESARRKIGSAQNLQSYFTKVLYRPFDIRHIFYHEALIWSPSRPVMKNYLNFGNIGLISSRMTKGENFNHLLVTNRISEVILLSSKTSNNAYNFPLFIVDDVQKSFNFGVDSEIKANINSSIVTPWLASMDLKYISIEKTVKDSITPTFIFYYIYAILSSQVYRNRYLSQLSKSYPRIPLIKEKETFLLLVDLGRSLVNLHLLGENPFDDSKTLLDEPEKWNVKVGGEKPAGNDDWKVTEVIYNPAKERVYVNTGQYFEGIENEVWEFMIGGYQVLDKWLKDRKKAERTLSTEDLKHYMKIVVSLRETMRIMKEIDEAIPEWPIK